LETQMGSNGTGIASIDAHDAGLDCNPAPAVSRAPASTASGLVP